MDLLRSDREDDRDTVQANKQIKTRQKERKEHAFKNKVSKVAKVFSLARPGRKFNTQVPNFFHWRGLGGSKRGGACSEQRLCAPSRTGCRGLHPTSRAPGGRAQPGAGVTAAARPGAGARRSARVRAVEPQRHQAAALRMSFGDGLRPREEV
jgi:hypothetical protein